MVTPKFEKLFGGPARTAETLLTQREMDIARSVQEVTEEVVLAMARHARKVTGKNKLCMAGGVALNCVANRKILSAGVFEDLWIQPASGDAGGALGAALGAWYQYHGAERQPDGRMDAMNGSFLGPAYSSGEIRAYLEKNKIPYIKMDEKEIPRKIAALLAAEKIVGWFGGRMEFGPRALGARSIIGDPRSAKMQEVMNLKIKFRESFRPFAPSVLADDVQDWFDMTCASPYMLLVAPVRASRQLKMTTAEESLFGIEKLNIVRSEIPAVTHVDYSARVQTVHRETNVRYYDLIERFKLDYGCPVIVNTSFNVRGEPPVCSPEDAYLCFMRTDIDYLVLEDCLLTKVDQPKLEGGDDWKKEFELD
jgi:carbamoyltransferase